MISPEALDFRKMREADLPVVKRLLEGACDHPWNEVQIMDSLRGPHECWVGCEANALTVYGVVSFTLDECELLNLCVDSAKQHQGRGLAMLRFLLDRARMGRQASMYLEVRASNKPAIRLYEGCGFNRLGVRKAYYPDGAGREDAWIYSLSLLSSS